MVLLKIKTQNVDFVFENNSKNIGEYSDFVKEIISLCKALIQDVQDTEIAILKQQKGGNNG